ncbi:hypothetical protein EK904_000891 [Melospiza melodia maxima]|nr:hypothetical protein EK904_000891 [Melospiza melodia maxima]
MRRKIPLNVLKEFWCLSLTTRQAAKQKSIANYHSDIAGNFPAQKFEQFYCRSQFQIGTRLPIPPQPSTCTHIFSETTPNHLYAKLQTGNESQHHFHQYLRINVIRVFFHTLEHRHLTNNGFSGQVHYELFFKADVQHPRGTLSTEVHGPCPLHTSSVPPCAAPASSPVALAVPITAAPGVEWHSEKTFLHLWGQVRHQCLTAGDPACSQVFSPNLVPLQLLEKAFGEAASALLQPPTPIPTCHSAVPMFWYLEPTREVSKGIFSDTTTLETRQHAVCLAPKHTHPERAPDCQRVSSNETPIWGSSTQTPVAEKLNFLLSNTIGIGQRIYKVQRRQSFVLNSLLCKLRTAVRKKACVRWSKCSMSYSRNEQLLIWGWHKPRLPVEAAFIAEPEKVPVKIFSLFLKAHVNKDVVCPCVGGKIIKLKTTSVSVNETESRQPCPIRITLYLNKVLSVSPVAFETHFFSRGTGSKNVADVDW